MAIGGVISPSGNDYLPLTGGTVTGTLTVQGGITGDLTGKATNAEKWGGMSLRLQNKTSVGDFLMPVFTTDTDMDYISSRQLFEQIMQLVWPVGSIYQSTDATNPGQLFGGTWQAITGRFLFAADNAHRAGTTGGEESHTLTTDELPSHNHGMGYIYRYDSTGTSSQQQMSNTGDIHTMYIDQSTGYTGGGKAHNNMPPYLSVYTWVRTA